MEKKSAGILVSQGAAANIIASFFLTFMVILCTPNLYNFLFLGALPIFIGIGALTGIVGGSFIYLSQLILKRCPGFLLRSAIAIVSIIAVGVIWFRVYRSIYPDKPPIDWPHDWSIWFWGLSDICFIAMSIGLITGSRIRPARLVLRGPAADFSRTNHGRWLSFPAALILRLAGLFGLMESLLLLAYWASSYVVAGWMELERPILLERIHLIPIMIAILYFTFTVYVSFTAPRTLLLLIVWILFNAPLLVWSAKAYQSAGEIYWFLSILAFIFIGLSLLMVAGRMISHLLARQRGKLVERMKGVLTLAEPENETRTRFQLDDGSQVNER
jgi:hypothetical protein